MKTRMMIALSAVVLAGLASYLLTVTPRAVPPRADAPGAGKAASALVVEDAVSTAGEDKPANPAAMPDGLAPRGAGAQEQPMPAARRLPAEAPYFQGDDLRVEAVRRILTGKRFGDELARLERQMDADPAASDLGRLYREALQAQFASTGMDGGVHRLACGRSLCMASMTSRASEATYQAWWNAFEASPAIPHTVGVDYSVDLGGGLFERRVLFVTDPASGGISDGAR